MNKVTRCIAMLSGLGGLLFVGGVSALPQAAANQLQLQPNHFAKPPSAGHGHGGGGGGSGGTTWPGWASSNWSGYAETGTFHSISANWTVPVVNGTRNSYSAAWVGIDGFKNNSLIQTGTEQDYYSGATHYGAWWTTSANGFLEQTITSGASGCSGPNCGVVNAGDQMTASISGSGTSWTLILANSSRGWSFTMPVTYNGPGASAEWIMEAPTVGGRVAPISNYSIFPFDSGKVNNGSPNLLPANGGELIQGGVVTSIPSAPDSDTDGFNSVYGSTQPSPPAS
jgi:hypothetical protein